MGAMASISLILHSNFFLRLRLPYTSEKVMVPELIWYSCSTAAKRQVKNTSIQINSGSREISMTIFRYVVKNRKYAAANST